MKNKETLEQLVLEEIFAERGMDSVREHIVRNIIGERIQPLKPHVSAIGTSGGKTWMTAARFELLYRMGYLTNDDKVLILAGDKDILRNNFEESFAKFFENKKSSFKWRVVKTKKDIQMAIKDGVHVFITIPQSLDQVKLDIMSKENFVWMVQDEAHHWYTAEKVQNQIIPTIKPKYQSLLTGTPFNFNDNANDYIIDHTCVREMYENGYLSDVQTQVLYSDVNLTQLDYESILGDLNSKTTFSDDETLSILNEVMTSLVKKVKVPFKGLHSTHNITSNASTIFNKLEKTILFARGIKEAECINKILRKNGVKTLITHSDRTESSTKVFDKFKEGDVKLLIAVGQGREGFDFPDLYNVIDMTFTQNFAMAMQMLGRVLRKSEKIKQKFYYKVAPKNMGGYFNEWMNGLFMMLDTEWYSVYNGKNSLTLPIPNKLVTKIKKASVSSSTNTNKGVKPKNLSYINSLGFMSKNKWFKLNGTISTISSTTLAEVVKTHKKSNKDKIIMDMVTQFDNLSDLIKTSPNLYDILRQSESWMGRSVYGKFLDYSELPNTVEEIRTWVKKNHTNPPYEIAQVVRTKMFHLLEG